MILIPGGTMSYGRTDVPCKTYRPWKGQEPLCGNCAWTKDEYRKENVMQPYQERVVAEKQELDEKISRLKEFIFGEGKIFRTLDPEERNRLEDQYTVMNQYSEILGRRIAAFQ
jgi:crAss001_48 related protein